MSQSPSGKFEASPSTSASGYIVQPDLNHKANAAAISPASDASGRAGGSSHAIFQHSMSAGFINAPPRLCNANPPRQDQRKRSSAAYQAFATVRKTAQGNRQQVSPGYLSDIAAEASGQSLVGKAPFPAMGSSSQTLQHQSDGMECDIDPDEFSWDYIKHVPSAPSGRFSRDVTLRSRAESVRGSLDYEFEHDVPPKTRRSKDCGERGECGSSLSGRSFPSHCSETIHG